MEHRKRTLLGVARQQEAERLRREQDHARTQASEDSRKAAEFQRLQDVLNIVGRAFFLRRYGETPDIIGASRIEDDYGEFATPIFAIEYANLRFNPGRYGIANIKYPSRVVWAERSPFAGRLFRKNFTRNELRIIDRYTPSIEGYSFEAVCLCSGCQTWGALGYFKDEHDSLVINSPKVDTYDQIAANIELFNEGVTGLALDCGTLPAFGLNSTKVTSAIGCANLIDVIEAENLRRKDNQPVESTKNILEGVIDAARAMRQHKEGKGLL